MMSHEYCMYMQITVTQFLDINDVMYDNKIQNEHNKTSVCVCVRVNLNFEYNENLFK